MPIEVTYDCEVCPAGVAKQFTTTLAGFGASTGGTGPDVNGFLVLTHTGGCTWSGVVNGTTVTLVNGVGNIPVLTWLGNSYAASGWGCSGQITVTPAAIPGYGESPPSIVLTPVDGGGGGDSGGGGVLENDVLVGFPEGVHHGKFVERRPQSVDGKAVYAVRCNPPFVGGRRISEFAGVKDGKRYYAHAECGPLRTTVFATRMPDGKALYAYADPCCGRRGSGSGSVAASGSVSGSVSGSGSGSGSGSVPGSGSVVSGSVSGLSGSGGVDRIVTPCGQVLPRIIYATFDGPLAGMTIALTHIGDFVWDSGFVDNPCGTPKWAFQLNACVGEGISFYGLTFPPGGCTYNLPMAASPTVLSFLPFLATMTAELVAGAGCPCSDPTTSVVLTETPP